jgi:hypothetical protein
MGFSRKRIGRDGKPRYTAYYRDIRDEERSAGTFGRKKAMPGRRLRLASVLVDGGTRAEDDSSSRRTFLTSGCRTTSLNPACEAST